MQSKEEQEESETKPPIKDDQSHDEKEVKTEPEDPPDKKPSETSDSVPIQVGSAPLPSSNVVTSVQESKPVESPQKIVRRMGKRKRRYDSTHVSIFKLFFKLSLLKRKVDMMPYLAYCRSAHIESMP